MRAFLTGGDGFVGSWLQEHLADHGDEIVSPGVDVTKGDLVRDAIVDAAPDAIYHLAALSHVGESWSAAAQTFEVNAVGSLHVLEAARACATPPTVLLVCSAEVYGVVGPESLPLTEESPLRPYTPYAASKVAAEYLGMQAFLGSGLPVVRVRSFNHVGPRQAPGFVVSALAKRIVEAGADGSTTLPVGNLSARRDFLDVRDVVRAYRLVVERGEPGEVYNVCSGADVAVADLAARMLAIAGTDLTLETDPALARPVDLPVLRGDSSRLRAATGWEPSIELDTTLADVLAYWESQ